MCHSHGKAVVAAQRCASKDRICIYKETTRTEHKCTPSSREPSFSFIRMIYCASRKVIRGCSGMSSACVFLYIANSCVKTTLAIAIGPLTSGSGGRWPQKNGRTSVPGCCLILSYSSDTRNDRGEVRWKLPLSWMKSSADLLELIHSLNTSLLLTHRARFWKLMPSWSHSCQQARGLQALACLLESLIDQASQAALYK
jgi:hypothetical protein